MGVLWAVDEPTWECYSNFEAADSQGPVQDLIVNVSMYGLAISNSQLLNRSVGIITTIQ